MIEAFEELESTEYANAEVFSFCMFASNQLGKFDKVISVFSRAEAKEAIDFEACSQTIYAAIRLNNEGELRRVFEKAVTLQLADAELLISVLPYLSEAQSSHYVKRIETSTLGRIKLIGELIGKMFLPNGLKSGSREMKAYSLLIQRW